MQKITPFLWFEGNAEEAAKFYCSVFKDSKLGEIRHGGPMVMSASFQLFGQEYIAFNGGPMFKLNEAFSMFVNCETQEEIDELWEKLSEGGAESRCGWLKDKFGLWWQIIPPVLGQLLGDKDPARAKRAMDAMLKMGKIDIATLKAAAEG